MKKVLYLPLLLLLAILVQGCASSKFVLADNSPLAIVSIEGTQLVPWYEVDMNDDDDDANDKNGVLNTLVNKMIGSDDPEIMKAVDRLDYLDDSLRENLEQLAGCKVLGKNDVLQSSFYKRMASSILNTASGTKTATGYKNFSNIGGKKARMLLNELNAKSLLIVYFESYKEVVKGTRRNGLLAARVFLKAKVIDEKGKEIADKTYVVNSSRAIEIESSYYDKDEFLNLISEASDLAVKKFAFDFTEGAVESSSSKEPEVNGTPITIKQKTDASPSNEEKQ